MRERRFLVVRCAYSFGTVANITDGIPNLGEHPKLKSSGRVYGLFETPDHRPKMR